MIEAIDLFCGVGGLSCGLSMEGIRIKAGIDIDPVCQYPFSSNHKNAEFLLRDISKIAGKDIKKYWSAEAIRLLAGCAPCQPFSSYANTRISGDHSKWGLLYEFARLVEETNPDLVVMENVPRIQTEAPFAGFLSTLNKLGYRYVYGVLNAADFGVPQHRRRLVLLASKIGEIVMPSPTHLGAKNWVTVRNVIENLPILRAGESDANDPLHRASGLSPLNLSRIRASRPGGTWRDWPEELIADCHKKVSGRHSLGVYGRMEWDKPAPTMTTLCNGYGNGRFGHPMQDRAISLREAAIFQSFPPKYKFIPEGQSYSIYPIARLIGNAVPPGLGAAIARAVKESLPR